MFITVPTLLNIIAWPSGPLLILSYKQRHKVKLQDKEVKQITVLKLIIELDETAVTNNSWKVIFGVVISIAVLNSMAHIESGRRVSTQL